MLNNPLSSYAGLRLTILLVRSINGVESIVPPEGIIQIFPAWSTMNNLLVSSGDSTTDKGETRFSATSCRLDELFTTSSLFFLQDVTQKTRKAVVNKSRNNETILL